MSSPHRFERVIGVDFSGAAMPGKLVWIAACDVLPDASLKLTSLQSLDELSGATERDGCLRWLVDCIAGSGRALWGMDFPFSLPVDIAGDEHDQLKWVSGFEGNAYDFGRVCVSRAMNLGEKLHLRRDTDIETKTPFDCYHYRIVCQTFHGMRDVLLPLRSRRGVAVVPLEMRKAARADTIVVEACPGSTLKRMRLPHSRYKDPTSRAVAKPKRAVRELILSGLAPHVEIDQASQRVALAQPGGDALDAIIAAVGSWDAWRAADLKAIARHPRYLREGLVFA